MEAVTPKKIKKLGRIRVFDILNACILVFMSLLCLFPFIYVLARSFSDATAISQGKVSIFPVGFHIINYRALIFTPNFYNGMLHSIILTSVGMLWTTAMTAIMAFPLSKKIKGGKAVMIMILITMLFSPGLVPNYVWINMLKINNTYFALWLPATVNAFNLLLVRAYFRSLPNDLEEAATIDGCSGFMTFIRIVLPLSLPIIATTALFNMVAYWNDFGTSLVYLRGTNVKTLPVHLNAMVNEGKIPGSVSDILSREDLLFYSKEGFKSAAIVLSALPMVLIYPFIQKYFAKGIMIGAIKA